jgi:hypothetical protein
MSAYKTFVDFVMDPLSGDTGTRRKSQIRRAKRMLKIKQGSLEVDLLVSLANF